MHWHCCDTQEVCRNLETSPQGLTTAEAARRLETYGPNALREAEKRPLVFLFLDQFKDFMILVLIAASVISGLIGEVKDTIAILVIVLLNAIIGFVQEYRAERAMAALKRMAVPTATVLRDGDLATVPAVDIVPGDVAVLEAGQIVPADMRLLEAAQLCVEEAALTGESVAVLKETGVLNDPNRAVGDRSNMAFKGTIVTNGRGRGLVVGTGMQTEIGRIAAMLQEEKEPRTPLQKRLETFGKKLAVIILLICAVVFLLGLLRGEQALLMFMTAVSLAVAAIPEALPAVITITLALGARKLIRHQALIRKLPAVETLGSVTYICSDKTGTLTLNRMAVEQVFVDGELVTVGGTDGARLPDDTRPLQSPQSLFLRALVLCNDAEADAEGNLIGDPTEQALYRLGEQSGCPRRRLVGEFPRVDEIPFDAGRKCMTTFHRWIDGRFISFTKGAVEGLLANGKSILHADGCRAIDRAAIRRVSEAMAAEGLRVLGVAMRVWDALLESPDPENTETDLTLLGLVGLMDPPRPEAKDAVSLCRSAGIVPVMITGDHPLTAKNIARRLGILEGKLEDESDRVITGRELAALSDQAFAAQVGRVMVYARVAPEQKLKIVKALQSRGQFVAMTGDGVNDAPALKRANIGVAMGITGTDVAREASHMILLDDNFQTIVRAVREGRKIFDNIRKFVKYTMTSNSGEIWTLFLAPFLGLPLPLLPIHILWINLVTDGLPGLALAAEPAERGTMERPPRPPDESIFAHGMWQHMLWVGLLIGGLSIGSQAWAYHSGETHWQTMVFTVLTLAQLAHVLAIRTERDSLFTVGLMSNWPLLGAVVITVGLQLAVIYVPALNPIFRTAPLSPGELLAAVLLSAVVFVAVETEKWLKRRRLAPAA